MTHTGEIFEHIPTGRDAEDFTALCASGGVRFERIVSTGQASPPGFWYDQDEDEFVMLLAGAARLRFADEEGVRELRPGSWAHIAARRRHRVEYTQSEPPTIWLAVFFPAGLDQTAKPTTD